MRTAYFLVIVLVQGEDFFKFFVAVVAEIVVHGHGENLPLKFVGECGTNCSPFPRARK
jgi:hypothetical protein